MKLTIKPSINYYPRKDKNSNKYPSPIVTIGITKNTDDLLFLGLQIRPFEWSLGIEHLYYDGRHCLWKFGPFWFENSWSSWCEKCCPNL